MSESTLAPTDVNTELARLADELKAATKPAHRAEVTRLIDKWLDESLARQGAHVAECDCDDCRRVVADALARRLGECGDVADVASVPEWGDMGTAPE